LSKIFRFDGPDLTELLDLISFKEIASGTRLLSAGDIATHLLIVMQGCLRQYMIKEDGKEVTFQFFVENQMVASFESAMTSTPSRLYVEAIEDSIVGSIPMKTLLDFTSKDASRMTMFNTFIMNRLVYYMDRCSSYILDNPENRYQNLVENNPDLVTRLPKQYIASYLGVTPVSLSRIRSRIKKKGDSN
jgi:CRP-like cAMP-binding protein